MRLQLNGGTTLSVSLLDGDRIEIVTDYAHKVIWEAEYRNKELIVKYVSGNR